jgi:predicted short-subunit dehydrogenase-like oxidoreductase (DUF2520 family)
VKVRIIGAGRAGRSFELALREAGVDVDLLPGRSPFSTLASAALGADVVLLAVPDRHVAGVARLTESQPDCAVLHCSGSLGLDVLEPHRRRGSVHPLATLPDPVVGSLRLRGGTFFAVSGDQTATDLALALGGQPIVVESADRAKYHAAACAASNHLVALLGQVKRIASDAGLPLEAFLPLARGALDDVTMLGPEAALTGPASRGDQPTIDAHRAAIDQSELAGYDAGVALARRLAADRERRRATATVAPAAAPAASAVRGG